VKDCTSISDQSWGKLRKNLNLQSILPSVYRIKRKRTEVDQMTKIHRSDQGCYITVKDKITNICKKIKDRLNLTSTDPLRIKFTGDGFKTSRNMTLFNFNFCIMNDQYNCKSSEGHYSIGVFKIQNENHANLENALKAVLKEIELINSIEIDGQIHNVIKYLSGDLKFLSLFMGVMSANSNYPCLWCKCHKCEFKDLTRDFSIIENQKGARSLEEAEEFAKNQLFGYKTIPLSRCFPFHYVIIDILHLFLRISDTLIGLLKQDFELIDGFTKDINKTKLLKRYCDFLQHECNVSKPYYISKKNNMFELTD
jgi:hypothetical protein